MRSKDLCDRLNLVHLNTQCLVSKTLNKLNSDFYKDLFKSHDILLFCESWTSEESELSVSNFECVPLHRTDKLKTSRRDSGGLVVYIRDSCSGGINVYCKDSDDIIIFRLLKDFFSFDQDIYLLYSYVLPENSARLALQDVFTLARIEEHFQIYVVKIVRVIYYLLVT